MINIVNRLRFDATRCELQFSKGVAGNITEGADEIVRLRGALEEIATFTSDPVAMHAAREALAPQQDKTP